MTQKGKLQETKALAYQPKTDEMQLTVHRWFADKSCPGEWLFSRMGELADAVTKRLSVEKEKDALIVGACVLRMGAGRKHKPICGMKRNQTFHLDGQYDIIDNEKWLHGFFTFNDVRYGGWVESKHIK